MIKRLKDLVQGKSSLSNKRDSSWHKESRIWLVGKVCAGCGGKNKLEVHHKVPFHVDRTKEMDPENWLCLCESKKNGKNCHLWEGHNGNYRSFNPNVEEDSGRSKQRIESR
jgi:5-methylcytosine-specific restriction enzyme A